MHIMTRLIDAKERLDQALARLETAVFEKSQATGSDRGALDAELAAVRATCDQLESRTRDVSARLDATIERMRSLLER